MRSLPMSINYRYSFISCCHHFVSILYHAICEHPGPWLAERLVDVSLVSYDVGRRADDMRNHDDLCIDFFSSAVG